MPIYNGYPQVYYPQQPQGQLEQLRTAQYQPQPVMMPTMQGQAAPTDSGFIWVQGEAAARGYLVANGSRVLSELGAELSVERWKRYSLNVVE